MPLELYQHPMSFSATASLLLPADLFPHGHTLSHTVPTAGRQRINYGKMPLPSKGTQAQAHFIDMTSHSFEVQWVRRQCTQTWLPTHPRRDMMYISTACNRLDSCIIRGFTLNVYAMRRNWVSKCLKSTKMSRCEFFTLTNHDKGHLIIKALYASTFSGKRPKKMSFPKHQRGILEEASYFRDPILRPGTPFNPILPTVDFSSMGGSGQPIVRAYSFARRTKSAVESCSFLRKVLL